MQKPELLSPAGSFEKLRAAVRFGADAVYLAGKSFGMRAGCDNFTYDELDKAIKYCHERGVKVYITINTMPRTEQYDELNGLLPRLRELSPDAFIIADLGVLGEARRLCPDIPVHISTQASVVSAQTCIQYAALGASRIVLARELSLEDIKRIRASVPPALELETFIHGAMCISYSGRCLLSNYFSGRDGNMGKCAQPCRYNYKLYTLREEKQPERTPGILECEDGTFIMSSRDMCTIEHIPELINAGINSFKIEGRMKSVYYAAVTAKVYREAIDTYFADPEGYRFNPEWSSELESVTHRKYDTGYFFGEPMKDAKVVDEPGYISEKPYYGIVVSYDEKSGYATVLQKNKLARGQTVGLLTPGSAPVSFTADDITDEEGNAIESTPHPRQVYKIKMPIPAGEGDLIK